MRRLQGNSKRNSFSLDVRDMFQAHLWEKCHVATFWWAHSTSSSLVQAVSSILSLLFVRFWFYGISPHVAASDLVLPTGGSGQDAHQVVPLLQLWLLCITACGFLLFRRKSELACRVTILCPSSLLLAVTTLHWQCVLLGCSLYLCSFLRFSGWPDCYHRQ